MERQHFRYRCLPEEYEKDKEDDTTMKKLFTTITAMIFLMMMTATGYCIIQSMETLKEQLDSKEMVMRTHIQDDVLWVWIDENLDGVCDRVHWLQDTGTFAEDGDMMINISGPLPCEEADFLHSQYFSYFSSRWFLWE